MAELLEVLLDLDDLEDEPEAVDLAAHANDPWPACLRAAGPALAAGAAAAAAEDADADFVGVDGSLVVGPRRVWVSNPGRRVP